MKVMISQPMRNHTKDEIMTEREILVKELVRQGHEVIDTIIKDYVPGQGNDYAIKCLAKSIEYISMADMIIFMRGWEHARGCRIEHEVALKYGKLVKEVC